MTHEAEEQAEDFLPESIAQDDEVEAAHESVFDEKAKNLPASLLQKMRRFFFKTAQERAAEQQRRLQELNLAIEWHPDAAVNYLIRGELFLEQKQYILAQDDFETALDLAEAQLQGARWAVAAQGIRDRALHQLDQVRRFVD